MPTQTRDSNVRDLFLQWKEILETGSLVPAASIAGDQLDAVNPLQLLINQYLAGLAAGLDETLTVDAHATAETEAAPTVPGLTVLSLLGQGGMGVVYKVRDALDREFALKLVRRKGLSQAGCDRFLDEARVMARLDHPNLARIHHYGLHDDRPYFLMQVYPSSLKERFAEFQVDPRRIVTLMADVAAAVGHLHQNGLIHRDLKPLNILLTADGSPAVSDLGLVKNLADLRPSEVDPVSPVSDGRETKPSGAKRSQTVAGAVVGTRRYMAPEQAAGLTHLANPRWDVWALGIMLHELFVGAPPEISNDPASYLNPATPDLIPPIQQKPDLDPKLDAIIRTCLAREEKLRYANGTELADEFKRLLAPTRNRRRRAVSAIVVLGLMLIGIAVWRPWASSTVHRNDGPDPASPTLEFQETLAQGKSGIVIGDSGWPIGYEMAVGADHTKPHVSEVDGTFSVDSSRLALIDFPPTGLDRFRFDVEVKQQTPDQSPRFGVYAGRHRLPARRGEADCYATLWFNNVADKNGDGTPKGRCTAALRNYVRIPGSGGVLNGVELPTISAFEFHKDHWYRLAIEVTPSRITWFFEGKAVASADIPLDALSEEMFADSGKLMPGIRTAFAPAGGYGVLVYGGPASFRRAVVKPLNE